VSQVMEANAWQRLVVRQQLMPLVGDGSRPQGTAVRLSDDKSAIRQGNAKLEKLFSLLDTMAA
jgi:hypothetical protein